MGEVYIRGLSNEDRILVNKIINPLAGVPVVRGDNERRSLMLSERLVIAETLVPVLKEVRKTALKDALDAIGKADLVGFNTALDGLAMAEAKVEDLIGD